MDHIPYQIWDTQHCILYKQIVEHPRLSRALDAKIGCKEMRISQILRSPKTFLKKLCNYFWNSIRETNQNRTEQSMNKCSTAAEAEPSMDTHYDYT